MVACKESAHWPKDWFPHQEVYLSVMIGLDNWVCISSLPVSAILVVYM